MGVDLDVDDSSSEEEDKEDRPRSDSQTARNPFAAPIKSVTREKVSQKAAANSDNPFAKPTAAPAEANDPAASPAEAKHELIEQAVQALGGESLWVCISKRGVAFRMSTRFGDKVTEVDGMDYGDICAVSDLVEGEDGIDFIKLATGAESDIAYYIPLEFENNALMVKLTCEDAVHGETTSIFRVDKDDGVNYLSVPVYGNRVAEGLDDNHVLTPRIVMVGENGHRFAFDPWRSLWVPERTAR